MAKKVPCEFEACAARVEIDQFDESVWLPIFKATREHIGFMCPEHAGQIRAERHAKRYLLSWSGPDELIIDLKPLEAEPKNGAPEANG